MKCAVCDAGLEERQPFCAVCGRAVSSDASRKWHRAPEAWAYEDLGTLVTENETLLGLTRGKLTGNWQERVLVDPRALLSPYANLGLTDRRAVFQYINPRDGRAARYRTVAIDIADVGDIKVTDDDELMPGRSIRVSLDLAAGGSVRLRTAGRLGELARDLRSAFGALACRADVGSVPPMPNCRACDEVLPQRTRFCPFCGADQGDGDE